MRESYRRTKSRSVAWFDNSYFYSFGCKVSAMTIFRGITILFLALSMGALCQTLSDKLLTSKRAVEDGNYVGLEPMQSESPHLPDALWYHENTIVLRNGELILDKNPILIQNGIKSHSASDGGFITYRGRLLSKNGHLYVALRPFASDYFFFPVGPGACEPYSNIDIFPVKVTEKGFWINGVFYTKQPVAADRLKFWEEKVKSEALIFDGKHPYTSKYKMKACQPNDLSVLDDY